MTNEPNGKAPNELSPALRMLLVEWRRVRITEANELSKLLGMPCVKVERGKADDGTDCRKR